MDFQRLRILSVSRSNLIQFPRGENSRPTHLGWMSRFYAACQMI